MKRLFAILDDLVPWLKPALLIAAVAAIVLVFGSWQCSRQEAAQSRQDARSAQAGTKTAKDTLERVIERHSTETHTREIVTQGQKDLDDEQDYRNFRRDVRNAACRMPNVGYDTACPVP